MLRVVSAAHTALVGARAHGVNLRVLKSNAAPVAAARGFQSSAVFRAPPPPPKVKVSVNNQELEVTSGCSVLQACEEAGVDIPRFCYHDRLSIAGNCRMCLVEVEKSPKPVASCAMPVMPGMKIKTDTPLVMKAREGVMEFLLANHPLDCPICDQGGECDLQDQSLMFGSDRSRFREYKRTVEDKNLGPFVKSIMTRCIHCTRCVRYAAEVAGVEDLGATGRGNGMEIGTYVEKPFDSEISGNVIDLCPVGALTSKPFAFTARPWELEHTESVDVHDAVGCNIRIDTRGAEVMRILPRLHEEVNEEWISDKTRFAYDGLKRQRLDTPMMRKGDDFVPVSWGEAFQAIAQNLKGLKTDQLKAIAGDLVDAESLIALKDLMNRLGSNNLEARQDGALLSADVRSDYLMNSTIAGVEDADAMLLVGVNPRMEAPVINARIRKSVVHAGLRVALLGPQVALNYPHQYLGNSGQVLSDIAAGTHPYAEVLKKAARPMIVVGMSALRRDDAAAIQATLSSLTATFPNLRTAQWNGLNVLQLAAARSAALDIGFTSPQSPVSDRNVKFVYLLGADDLADKITVPKGAFVVYQGHHGDAGASQANVILPGAAYTEKDGTYVNTEGRVQRTKAAAPLVGDAREDWKILRALSEVLGVPLPYETLTQVRARLEDVAPHLVRVDTVEKPTFHTPAQLYAALKLNGAINANAFRPTLSNFFMTDAISRSSKVMAKATQTLKVASNSYAQEPPATGPTTRSSEKAYATARM